MKLLLFLHKAKFRFKFLKFRIFEISPMSFKHVFTGRVKTVDPDQMASTEAS